MDIARYVAWFGQRGIVAATSLTPYLSAIISFLQDHALPPIALGSLVVASEKGLRTVSKTPPHFPNGFRGRHSSPTPSRSLPKKLLLKSDWTPQAPHLSVLRAIVATIASYVFFNRGEWSACALAGDIVTSITHITLLLWHEKGKKGLLAGYMNVRQIASHEAPRIAALLRAFFKGQQSIAQPRAKLTHRWSISPREDVEMWSALTLTEWLRTAYTTTGHLLPEGFNWTSHNLRSQRHWSAPHGHPLPRWMGDELQRPRREAH